MVKCVYAHVYVNARASVHVRRCARARAHASVCAFCGVAQSPGQPAPPLPSAPASERARQPALQKGLQTRAPDHTPGVAMAASRSRSAPPPSVSSALVPYEPPLQCVGCDRQSTDVLWGQHMVTYASDRHTVLSRKPRGALCADCRQTALVAFAPEVKPWEEVEQLLRSQPKKKAAFAEWGLRLSGQRLPKYPQSEVRQGTRAGVRWEDVYIPMSTKEVARRFPGVVPGKVPGVRIDALANSQGEAQEVVLTRPEDTPSRIVIYYESEATHHELLLRPDRHLRQPQGSEWWGQALTRVMQARPTAVPPTLKELDELIQRHTRGCRGGKDAQPIPSPRASAASGAQVGEDPDMPVEVLDDGIDDDVDYGVDDHGCPIEAHAATEPPTAGAAASADLANSQVEVARKSAPETNRRLRPHGSDPAAPARKQPRRARPNPTPSPTGSGGEVTIAGLLAGTVAKPKVALYHCRQRCESLEKTADQATIMAEKAGLQSLLCADRLSPANLPRLPDEEFRACLQSVVQRLGPESFPAVFALGLVRRRALEIVGQNGLPKLDAQRLLRTCWPWAQAGGADSHALAGVADSHALAAGIAGSPPHAAQFAFNPQEPMLAHVSSISLTEKISWSSDFLVKEALITVMARKASPCPKSRATGRLGKVSMGSGPHLQELIPIQMPSPSLGRISPRVAPSLLQAMNLRVPREALPMPLASH